MSAPSPPEAQSPSSADLRESIRTELEQTRKLYLELAASANESNWNHPSGNPVWTVGQMLGHIIIIYGGIPWKLKRVRQGKGAAKPPDFIFNPLNEISTRFATRKYRPDNIVPAYEEAHQAALEALDDVKDHEWTLRAKFFGEQQDMPELFRYHVRHVREHEPHIRAGTVE